MNEVTADDIIYMLDAVTALGKELGNNVVWEQYTDVRNMLGMNCIHTRQAARNLIENKQAFEKLKILYKSMEPVFTEQIE
jgi:hypothetical protein